jgi:hypothetical protein
MAVLIDFFKVCPIKRPLCRIIIFRLFAVARKAYLIGHFAGRFHRKPGLGRRVGGVFEEQGFVKPGGLQRP